jgi:hypothetical protein
MQDAHHASTVDTAGALLATAEAVPTAKRCGRRRLPGLAMLCAATLLSSSCRYLEVRRVEADAPDHGIFAVSMQRRSGRLWIWQHAFLPGVREFDCAQETTGGRAKVRHCPGVDARQALDLLAKTREAVLGYFPELRDVGLEVALVPRGVHMRVHRSDPFDPQTTALQFPVRWDGSPEAARFALRAVAHEAAHVARGTRGSAPSVEEEVVASAIESCVEHDVMGATRGFVYTGEFGTGGEQDIAASVVDSTRGFGKAFAVVMQFAADGEEVIDSAAFRSWCGVIAAS